MHTSEIRRRIHLDHQQLLDLVKEVESAGERILAGDQQLVSQLRERGLHLYMSMRRHLDFEDLSLMNALRDHGSYGNQLADDLQVEHRDQRELLAYLLERLRDATQPSALLVQDFINFAALLRDDMQAEESGLLKERFFGDDPEALETL